MAKNSFKTKNSLNLEPQSRNSSPDEGDLYYDLAKRAFAQKSDHWSFLEAKQDVVYQTNMTSSLLNDSVTENSIIKITGSPVALFNLHGLAMNNTAKLIHIFNDTNQKMVIKHLSATETVVANRITTPKARDLSIAKKSLVIFYYDDVSQTWIASQAGGGGSGGTAFDVLQAGHGFSVLTPIYHNGTQWVAARADVLATTASYVVTEVAGDSFTATKFGVVEVPSHGLTVGRYYYVSTTSAGTLTSTEPTAGYSNPVLYVEDSLNIHIMCYRPLFIESVIGDANTLTEDLKIRLLDSYYQYVTPNVIKYDAQSMISSATATYDVLNRNYNFASAGNNIISTNMFCDEFASTSDDSLKLELHTEWVDSYRDDAATYQLSIDGGSTFETVTMERQGLSNKFTGRKSMSEPTSVSLDQNTVNSTEMEFNNTGNAAIAIKIRLTQKSRISKITLPIYKRGSPSGVMEVNLRSISSGVPGDFIESRQISLLSVASGLSNVEIPEFNSVLPAGIYYIEVNTNTSYKNTFVAGSTSISIRYDNTYTQSPSDVIREPSSGEYYTESVYAVHVNSQNNYNWYWNGVLIATNVAPSTTLTSGGYTYYRGSVGGISNFGYLRYKIYRTSVAPDDLTYSASTSTWSAFVRKFGHIAAGHVFDLRVKITSSSSGVRLRGYGVFYDEVVGAIQSKPQSLQKFTFSGALNTYSFTVNSFLPDPNILKVYDIRSGQVYRYPAFAIGGHTISFPSGTFYSPSETIELLFDQTEGGGFDNSDANLNLLAANHLGSTDATIDKSVSGRGILLRRPDGTLREIIINNDDNIEIWDV